MIQPDVIGRCQSLLRRADEAGESDDRTLIMGDTEYFLLNQYSKSIGTPGDIVRFCGALVVKREHMRGVILEVQPPAIKPPKRTYA